MSPVEPEVDLAALARREPTVEPPKRGVLRFVVPLVILVAFVWLLRDAISELLAPRPEVTLARPVALEGAGDTETTSAPDAPRQVALQAAGWVEPDPFPTYVPALDGGIVLEVLVQESDVVERGDVVARLVDDDARIGLDAARADLAAREAALDVARVRAAIASERFDAALEVTEALARAEAALEGARAEAVHRAEAVAEGEAKVALAVSEVVVQNELDAAGASGARQVEIAEAEVEIARAGLAVLRADAALAQAKATEAEATFERARRDSELRFADRLARDESRAAAERAAAEVDRARAALRAAELRSARTTVVAAEDGIVLERLAAAGDTLAVGAPVCTLYDPKSLRIRVDVPQGDVERLGVGQAAEALTDARPGRPYVGEVVRVVQRADIQKVTLEAQVRITEPDGLLRPDMLAQVRFFGKRAAGGSTAGRAASPTARIALETRLVRDGAVWVHVPAEGVARRRALELGETVRRADGTEVVEVLGGLEWTEEVVDGGRDAVASAAGEDGEVAVEVKRPALPERANKGGDER